MNFNTAEFIILFFPITLLLFFLSPKALRLVILALASSFFYGVSGFIPLQLMYLAILWGYLIAFVVQGRSSGWVKLFSVSVPFLLLFLYKYLRFSLRAVGLMSDEIMRQYSFILAVALPVGISFYTFQVASYLIDVCDKKIKPEKNFLRFFVYISFFPQLVAGPIVRYDQIRDQLKRISSVRRINPNIVKGLKFISIGLFFKIFLADFLGTFVTCQDALTTKSSADAIFAIFSYSFQIYYDFWAYSIIAIGLAQFFGIDLPWNFREPYLSPNPKDFWRRWHITLSYWMRDYLYLRLGGNKSYYVNIIIVFFIVGAWHGADYRFLAWGLYHAGLVLGYNLLKPVWDRFPIWFQKGITFVLVSFGWPLFTISISNYFNLLKVLISFNWGAVSVSGFNWVYLGLIGAWTFFVPESLWLRNEKQLPLIDSPIMHAVLCVMAILFFTYSRTFIYYRF